MACITFESDVDENDCTIYSDMTKAIFGISPNLPSHDVGLVVVGEVVVDDDP